MKRTRILVDASIVKPDLGGIATYAVGLVDALAEWDDLDLTIATSEPERWQNPRVETAPVPPSATSLPRRAAWRERALPGLIRASRADVLLVPTIELPFRRPSIPSVVVVHDVGPLIAPAFYGRPRWLRYQADLPRVCRQATRVVCVSRTTALQLEGAVAFDASKVRAIPQGVRALPEPSELEDLPPYVLYVGSLLPHKNVHTLVAAFAAGLGLDNLDLRVVGPASEAEAAAFEEARAATGRAGAIVHEGFVTAERLASLYRGATAVGLPSLFEGFGLPLAEAMTQGAPAVATELPAFREVGGDAPLYVEDPLSPQHWAQAILHVTEDAAATERRRARGLELAGRHTWKRAGADFHDELVGLG